jgi:hypothetical protein
LLQVPLTLPKHYSSFFNHPRLPIEAISELAGLLSVLTTMNPTKTFPFLSLPTEIRLMIYERIPVIVKVHSIRKEFGSSRFSFTLSMTPCCFSIIDTTVSTAILSTCRIIFSESKDIIQRKKEELAARPLRMVIDLESAADTSGGPISHVADYLTVVNWMLDNGGKVPNVLNCPAAYHRVRDDPNWKTMLPVMFRWNRHIATKETGPTSFNSECSSACIEVGIATAASNGTEASADMSLLLVDLIGLSGLLNSHYNLRLVRNRCPAVTNKDRRFMQNQARIIRETLPGPLADFGVGDFVLEKEYEEEWMSY